MIDAKKAMGIKQSERKFCTERAGKCANHKKTVYALLQQCIDQELTVREAVFVLNAAIHHIENAYYDSPLRQSMISSSDFFDK